MLLKHRARGFSKATVQAYRAKLVESGLAASTVNLRMTALRRLAAEAADNGLLAPETAAAITARQKHAPARRPHRQLVERAAS